MKNNFYGIFSVGLLKYKDLTRVLLGDSIMMICFLKPYERLGCKLHLLESGIGNDHVREGSSLDPSK